MGEKSCIPHPKTFGKKDQNWRKKKGIYQILLSRIEKNWGEVLLCREYFRDVVYLNVSSVNRFYD
jgi:hypothetical protein